MTILLTKLLFLLIGLYAAFDAAPTTIIVLLLAVTISALLQYYESAVVSVIGLGLFTVICFFLPVGVYFFPVLLIGLVIPYKYYLILLVPLLLGDNQLWFVLTMALAFICGHLLKQVNLLNKAYITLQDSHTEQSLVLRNKNKELQESQNEAASIATLQERTRIARDIHDNVGHILVRGILLTGVLKTTNNSESIEAIESTLKEAMDTIRAAVHDWKDEALDLRKSVEKLSASTTLDVDLQYDVSEQTPTDIKLCFLMIIKEALTNATKHSNATAIRINLQQHPSLYQLLIKDNGNTVSKEKINHGMGLNNIEERILALGGTCSFESHKGFRIFVSIPILE